VQDWRETIHLNHRRLVHYILSQSNAIVAVAAGSTSETSLRTWLLAETEPFFGNEESSQPFPHWGTVACLQRT
jgi:hypothetical protein